MNNTFDYSRFVIDGDLYLQKGDGFPVDLKGRTLDLREKTFHDFVVSATNVGDVLLEGLEVKAYCFVSDKTEVQGKVVASEIMEIPELLHEIAEKFKRVQV